MTHQDSMSPSGPTVGRLAPSPTGGLHVGHARTFVVAWLAARSAGGSLVLRVEDIDGSRVRPGASEAAVEDLRWLGLDWDAGPYVQSERMATYGDALERLKRGESVYPCTCTRSEIARAASAPHAGEEGPSYPGICAGRSVADADGLGERPFVWRFRVPPGGIEWNDLFAGPQTLDPGRHGGDFIVARSPFAPSYQLAVVVDDSAMGVNQVVRGADLIPSTPRQILLHSALANGPRRYGHVPLVHGPDGRRLAKREDSIKLATLRDEGVSPRRLVGWIARSCGWTDRLDDSTPRDWIARFSASTLRREPCVFDRNQLDAGT